MSLHIRTATADDAELILRFILDLAIFDNAEHEVKTDAAGLRDNLFGPGSNAHALICERDGTPIGYAVYFFNFSTWLGTQGLFLDDLYVSPEHRGCGAGKALLQHLARIAVSRDCGRFEWLVLDWNQPAMNFYQSFGARPLDDCIPYRLTGQALLDFAAG